MTLTNLKEEAKKDMVNNGGEIGFAEAIINNRNILVTAKKWGSNKPGRNDRRAFRERDQDRIQKVRCK